MFHCGTTGTDIFVPDQNLFRVAQCIWSLHSGCMYNKVHRVGCMHNTVHRARIVCDDWKSMNVLTRIILANSMP